LYGESGWITGNTNSTYLDVGPKFVQLYFNGTRLYSNRIDEAFDVFFYLGNDFGAFQDEDSYTTDFYKYVQFQPPYASFQTPHSDFPLDANGDSIYDYLVVNASVSVTKAGWYELEGNFYSESGWIASKTNYTYLDAGSQQIQLYFDETHLYNNKMKEIFIVHFYLHDETKTYLDYGNYTTDLGSGVLDVVAPWIIATTPMDRAIGINVTLDTIEIEFSEPMNKSSVKSAISINPAKYIQDYTWEGNVLKLSLSSKLVKGGKYTVTIGSGAKDKAGNALEEPYTWSFTAETDAIKNAEAEDGGFLLMLFIIPIIIIVIVVQLVSYLKKKKRKSADLLKEERGGKKKNQKTTLKIQTRYERRNL
jgi:hypothetical protein